MIPFKKITLSKQYLLQTADDGLELVDFVNLIAQHARIFQPARLPQVLEQDLTFSPKKSKFLLVDLNNFASFPTLAVGILVAALRSRGHNTEVLCPLSYDVPATQREHQERLIDHIKRRIHLTDWEPALGLRDAFRSLANNFGDRPHPILVKEVRRALGGQPDAILISAYLQHFSSVKTIAELAKDFGVPVILGGPAFNNAATAKVWASLKGVSVVVGAEVDRDLPALAECVVARGNILNHAGVFLPDGTSSNAAAPLQNLDAVPIPDFTDFPWNRYPVRIVPVMTGRGCQWDKCQFCSDVQSVSGRSFRTRSVENVLLEMQEQARRHETSNFLFLDLKLNSWPGMIRGIAKGIAGIVRGAEWVGTVHVDERPDNGLSRSDLEAAVEGGMRRISFGLESGSQRLLQSMRKGSSVARNSTFIKDAHAAGLSIRCTMFKGYPGETADDMESTFRFLEEHAPYIDRVRFNDFSIYPQTPIWHVLNDKTSVGTKVEVVRVDVQRGRINYRNMEARSFAYRKAKASALAVVYEINRRALRDSARQFDGLM